MSEIKAKSRNFIAIIYPEDSNQMRIFDYLNLPTVKANIQFVTILHNKDKDEDGKLKKAHYHLLIKMPTPYTLTAIQKFFKPFLNYIEICSNVSGSLLYFLHLTPDSLNKHQYDFTELQGEQSIIKTIRQSSHFAQLSEICDIIEGGDGSMLSLLRYISNSSDELKLDYLKNYQSLICTLTNQEFKRRQDYDRE